MRRLSRLYVEYQRYLSSSDSNPPQSDGTAKFLLQDGRGHRGDSINLRELLRADKQDRTT
jgi:hypothetical protein